ncbi:MAG: glutamate 5-kinase [Pirellulales bacterium]
MTDQVRAEVAASAETIIVKVGTRVLTRDDGLLDQQRIAELAEELASLADSGRRVALVSSGAVSAGMGRLGITRRPGDLAQLQAVAAIGQSHLIETYERALRNHGRHAAQLLLTADDLNDRTRYLNVRNTLLALFRHGAMPIINENDTVSVEELQNSFGDNDRLAAMVTNLLRAPLLVLLSDVEGLYDGDPTEPGSAVIPTVERLDASVFALARAGQAGISKGGMASKLEAARIATSSGENVIIASGRRPGVLSKIVSGEPVGTLFLAQGQSVTARKRWIGHAVRPRGFLKLDDGARRAIEEQGRSLLAIGIIEVAGEFKKGDVVALRDAQGDEFARGLTNFPSRELLQIQGRKSNEFEKILGHRPYDEVIHRDNLVISGKTGRPRLP